MIQERIKEQKKERCCVFMFFNFNSSAPNDKVPDANDVAFQMPRCGGIYAHQVCVSFSIHIHELVRTQIEALEKLATPQTNIRLLAQRLCSWTREKLLSETEAWLRACPALAGMYQFTFTEMIRQYSLAFPIIKKMGIRVPPLTDFVYCLLTKIYEDPRVLSGNFSTYDNNLTYVIVLQRLNATLCEALKVIYFPNFSPATSALWKIEPQIPDLFPQSHPGHETHIDSGQADGEEGRRQESSGGGGKISDSRVSDVSFTSVSGNGYR